MLNHRDSQQAPLTKAKNEDCLWDFLLLHLPLILTLLSSYSEAGTTGRTSCKPPCLPHVSVDASYSNCFSRLFLNQWWGSKFEIWYWCELQIEIIPYFLSWCSHPGRLSWHPMLRDMLSYGRALSSEYSMVLLYVFLATRQWMPQVKKTVLFILVTFMSLSVSPTWQVPS